MHIRALGLDDLLSLLALYGQLHPQDSVRPSGAVARAAFAHPGLTHYGGFVDGQLVASCNLAVIPNLTRGGRAYGVIENVITDAAHRSQGRGRALITQALQAAWALDCYKVVLTTSRKDPAVLDFYEACGFDRHDKTAFVARPPAKL